MASLYVAKPFDQLVSRGLGPPAGGRSARDVPVLPRGGAGDEEAWAAAASSTSPTGSWPAAGRAIPGYLPYYVAKAGVKALTEALALELAADQILVNAIAPGPILAPPDMSEDRKRRGREEHAARTMGRRSGDCEGGDVSCRVGFRDRRNHSRRRRKARQVRREVES